MTGEKNTYYSWSNWLKLSKFPQSDFDQCSVTGRYFKEGFITVALTHVNILYLRTGQCDLESLLVS